MSIVVLKQCLGFQWDNGNSNKNWDKHVVSASKCEQVFFNKPLLLADDAKHSQNEKRYYVLGKTNEARKLFLVFTIRQSLIRVISARDINKAECKIYEKACTNI